MNPPLFSKEQEGSQLDPTVNPPKSGPRCRQCGSTNTSPNSFLRPKPSILAVIFFGWYYLFIRGAFSTRTSVCRDCEATTRYKSTRSWIALTILILFALLIGFAILEEYL